MLKKLQNWANDLMGKFSVWRKKWKDQPPSGGGEGGGEPSSEAVLTFEDTELYVLTFEDAALILES